ncbi:MAG: YHS domain protein [Flavobacterium sp.]|uniref:YHS domain-containing (seleno)protein n=1 Tax=Flavobacterium sp. TaxID=239 RepID=UPI0025BCE64C|nr:YHS domain-containing (seleno)protein [Flavobacterium sp.]MCA1967381.1 YHS domain protein [Flavobacterium sp.]
MKPIQILLTLLFWNVIFSQNSTLDVKHLNIENGIALSGYDPVSYFVASEPKLGDKKISLKFQGVIYLFSSQKNKDTFLKSPTTYLPQYGGWCAFAMGDYGEKVEVNPKTFKIIDGKLYLFYNSLLNNTLKSWNKNEKKLKTQADKNWKAITN